MSHVLRAENACARATHRRTDVLARTRAQRRPPKPSSAARTALLRDEERESQGTTRDRSRRVLRVRRTGGGSRAPGGRGPPAGRHLGQWTHGATGATDSSAARGGRCTLTQLVRSRCHFARGRRALARLAEVGVKLRVR